MDSVESIVVGAGVVGLAVARALALCGREVLVLEAADMIGTGTSSRSSEVLHAGFYYPTGSLKARLCVEGRAALVSYCEARGVPYRLTGKLVVAQSEAEEAVLRELLLRGAANGVDGLALIDADEAGRLEPAVRCRSALLSAATGIVDSHALMVALLGDAEAAGAVLAVRSSLREARAERGRIVVHAGADGEEIALACRVLVNAAGLDATPLARRIRGLPPDTIPPIHYTKGSYFSYSGRPPFARPVYPVPEVGGLGIHATPDLSGQIRFGPDIEWAERPNYDVDIARKPAFAAGISRYFPGLDPDRLQPGYAGVRPRLAGPDVKWTDFRIDGPEVHGVPGLVNLFGMESPGLTSSLAIAREVRERLEAAPAGAAEPLRSAVG